MLILPDSRNTFPTEILCVSALTVGTSDSDDPCKAWHRLRMACFISARREKGRWTRQKRLHVKSAVEFSELLKNAVGFSRPTYLFSLKLMETLTVGGFWGLLESGHFNLSQMKTLSPVTRSHKRKHVNQSEKESGVLLESGSTAAVVAWSQQGAKIVATDIRNYIDVPARVLGDYVKLDWPAVPDEDAPDRDWEHVSERQATIIYRCITEIVDWWVGSGMGTFGLTAGQCSMSAYKSTINGTVIETPDDQECRDLERAAYFGGRLECLWVGKKQGNRYIPHPRCLKTPDLFHKAPGGTLHLVDASSFYGYIHANHPVPIRLTHRGNGMTTDEARQLFTRETFLASVLINCNAERFPTRVSERTIYAAGRFATCLVGAELSRAASTASIVGVGEWHNYLCVPAMERVCTELYADRSKAMGRTHPATATFIKVLIAALHGKWSQRQLRWEVCPDEPCLQEWGTWSNYSNKRKKLCNYRAIGASVQVESDGGDANHCFPAIAAFTTAAGRETLRLWEKVAGERNVLYLNTDSMIVTDNGLERLKWAGLMDDTAIGGLKLKASSPDIEIRGQGCFSFAGKLWMSGINRSDSEMIFGTVSSQQVGGLSQVIANHGKPAVRVITHELSPGWYFDPTRTDDDGWISPMVLNDTSSAWIDNMMNRRGNQDDRYD